jgi:hypothetical protein
MTVIYENVGQTHNEGALIFLHTLLHSTAMKNQSCLKRGKMQKRRKKSVT